MEINYHFCKNEITNYFSTEMHQLSILSFTGISLLFQNLSSFLKVTSEALFLFRNRSSPQLIPYFLNYLFYSYVLSNAAEAQNLMYYYSFRHWIFLVRKFSVSSVHQTLSSCTYLLCKNGAQWIFSKVTSPSYLACQDEQVLNDSFHSICTTISAAEITCEQMSQPPRREIIFLSSA